MPPEEEETDLQKLRRAAKDGDLEAGMTGNDRVSSDVLSSCVKLPFLACAHVGIRGFALRLRDAEGQGSGFPDSILRF